MGTRGGGRWAHLVLGRMADAVIREAPCPVVSVARDPAAAAAPEIPVGVGNVERQPAATA